MVLALRCYGRQMARLWRFTVPAMLLPALGNTCIFYVAPLIVAQLVGRFAGHTLTGIGAAMPYVLGFAGVLLFAEIVWRIGIYCLIRLEGHGIENLYVIGMDELLAKDAAFFHDNFAGSLTKRVLSFASRFEDFTDNLVFNIVGSLVPLVFASVVLWRYDPLLVAGLIGLIAITGAGDRTADPPSPEARRPARGSDRARVRARRRQPDEYGHDPRVRCRGPGGRRAQVARRRPATEIAAVVGLREPAHRHAGRADVGADQRNRPAARGRTRRGQHGIEAIMVAFTYYSNATRIMFEFNQIYRQMESSLTEAAQFTELLLTPPTVVDPIAPEPLRPKASDVRFERVTFAHAGGLPLFTGLDLAVPSGTKLGLVGRSGGGKSTLTRLLLRMMDIDDGRILIGGQDISKLRQSDLRSLIAYVPQDPAMFHRTLRDNIAFARPHATDAEIHQAAQAAHVTEFAGRPAGRIRHDGRRAWREAVRRAAAASRAGPGDPA